jgi:hypothetical protein
MLDKIFPSLKTRALIDERRFDMSRSDNNSERYVIPMHRENVWTNKWMWDPRNNFLHVSYYDPCWHMARPRVQCYNNAPTKP